MSLLPALGQERKILANEMRHAEIARELVESGDWLFPTLLGQSYFDKPPLFHWLVGLFYQVAGGQDLFLARLASVACALAAICVWFRLSSQLADRKTAFLSAASLLAIPGFAWAARVARPDMMFVLAILLSCLALVEGMRSQRGSARAAWLSFFAGGALGWALICKGPVSLLVVLSFAILAPKLQPGLRRLTLFQWVGFLSGLLAIAALWSGSILMSGGEEYLRAVLFQPDLPWAPDRHEVPAQYGYYLKAALLGLIPLSLFLPWLARRVNRAWLSPVMFMTGLVVLTLIDKKRGHYLLPFYPFATLAIWHALAIKGENSGRLLRAGLILTGLAIGANPVRHALFGRAMSGPDPSQLRMAAEFLEHVPNHEPLVCQKKKMAYSLAFEGSRTDVEMINASADDFARQMELDNRSGYVVAESSAFASMGALGIPLSIVLSSDASNPGKSWQLGFFEPRTLP